jgi:hypothetical protein
MVKYKQMKNTKKSLFLLLTTLNTLAGLDPSIDSDVGSVNGGVESSQREDASNNTPIDTIPLSRADDTNEGIKTTPVLDKGEAAVKRDRLSESDQQSLATLMVLFNQAAKTFIQEPNAGKNDMSTHGQIPPVYSMVFRMISKPTIVDFIRGIIYPQATSKEVEKIICAMLSFDFYARYNPSEGDDNRDEFAKTRRTFQDLLDFVRFRNIENPENPKLSEILSAHMLQIQNKFILVKFRQKIQLLLSLINLCEIIDLQDNPQINISPINISPLLNLFGGNNRYFSNLEKYEYNTKKFLEQLVLEITGYKFDSKYFLMPKSLKTYIGSVSVAFSMPE